MVEGGPDSRQRDTFEAEPQHGVSPPEVGISKAHGNFRQ